MIDKKAPNFFVIGVVKGGTTSLYHYLEQHPEVYMPPVKETNHFAVNDINHGKFLPEYAMDVRVDMDAYIASGMKRKIHIAHVDEERHYIALFQGVDQEIAKGEVSNSYMICPSAAKAIHDFNPYAKNIVVLRNPISRVWSQYLMNLREAKSRQKDFINEIVADDQQKVKGWGVNHQYLELGMYSKQLRPFIDHFGRENVLVLFYEDFRANPELVMRRICDFLEVSNDFLFDFSTESNKASMPRNSVLNTLLVKSGFIKAAKRITPKFLRGFFAKVLYQNKNVPRMSIQEKQWLVNYYIDEINNLIELIGEEPLIHWPEFKAVN